MHSSTLLSLLTTLPVLVSAHFQLTYPPSRGTDDEEQATFPCGGHAQTQNRTSVPLNAIGLSMDLGHTENLITVALAIGNDVGDSFNTIILPTIQEFGPGLFCLPSVSIPSDLGIEDGTNATIQVITNAHSGGGLYNCADITFSSTVTSSEPSQCSNGTGISATPLASDAYTLANATESHEGHEDGESSASASESGASATGTAAAASGTTTPGAAAIVTAGWGVLGAAVLGAVALL